MPGNENHVIKFLFDNKNYLKINHINKVKSIKIPKKGKLIEIKNLKDIEKNSSSDSSKKADIYLNDIGISIKEVNGNPYNKLYRKDLNFINTFVKDDKITNDIIDKIENRLKLIHRNDLKRDVVWKDLIDKKYFKPLLEYLMLFGKPFKKNEFPAKYILVCKKKVFSNEDLKLLTFNEYFDLYENRLSFAFRRVWYGMTSDEHRRAKNICFEHKNSSNWCFKTIIGKPRKRKDGKSIWRSDISSSERRTAYYINIGIIKNET